jgi:hypothetical protein
VRTPLFNGPQQRLALSQQVSLTEELGQRRRPHAVSKGSLNVVQRVRRE